MKKQIELERVDWQTKDFECALGIVELKQDCIELRGKYYDNDFRQTITDYHGYVNFYGSLNSGWFEFLAKYTDGKLVEVKRISNPYAKDG